MVSSIFSDKSIVLCLLIYIYNLLFTLLKVFSGKIDYNIAQ